MKRGHSWNRTSHFIQHLWNYRSWLVVHQLQSRSFQFRGFMQYISLYGFWWVFGNDFFKFKRKRLGFPPTSPKPPEDDSQPRSQTHVAQSHDAPRPVLGEFRETCFWKEAKKALQDSWGGLGKVDCRSDMSWYSIIFSWYFRTSFRDNSLTNGCFFTIFCCFTFVWNCWMFCW